jgi:hypothetical protein
MWHFLYSFIHWWAPKLIATVNNVAILFILRTLTNRNLEFDSLCITPCQVII